MSWFRLACDPCTITAERVAHGPSKHLQTGSSQMSMSFATWPRDVLVHGVRFMVQCPTISVLI